MKNTFFIKILKDKLFFLSFLVTLCVAGTFFYFIQKNEANVLMKEPTEIKIVDETQNQSLNDENKKVEEELLESDAEDLGVNDESDSEQEDEEDPGAKDESGNFSTLESPSKQNTDPNVLKIGFMTDLHVKNGGNGLLGGSYTKKINYFVEKMNKSFVPNFILLNGDIIEGTNTNFKVGSSELSQTKKLFDRTTIEKYWVVGNHDLRSVDKNQWEKSLGINYLSKSFDAGNYRIIILDSNSTRNDGDVNPQKDYMRGNVSNKQLEWLRGELKKTKKQILVFMHHPPLRDVGQGIASNLLFNAAALQEIFSKYNVLAVFSGHVEDLYYKKIDGVYYFVSPGMVKYPKYLGAFSEITVSGKKISIQLNSLKEDGSYRIIDIEKND